MRQTMSAAKTKPPLCSQCGGKPAIGEVGGQPLCVECYTKLQTAHAAAQNTALHQVRHAMAMMNYSEDLMWSMTGFGRPPGSRRVQIPAMPATGPVTLNNIKLNNSIVGSINTGNVRDIEINLGQLHDAGLDKLSNAITALSQAVVDDKQATAEEKNALLEQVAFLSSQATAAAQQRKPGMIKAAIGAIASTATTITGIAGTWQACEPLLKTIFGIE
jgi:hypothetical protein